MSEWALGPIVKRADEIRDRETPVQQYRVLSVTRAY